MENNWKLIIGKRLGEIDDAYYPNMDSTEYAYMEEAILDLMNLVFEATKKECADKADTKRECNFLGEEWIIDKDSILNINKPNL